MAYEPKPGQGSLWKNDRKEKDNHPDMKGSILCPCCKADMWLSGWSKTHDSRGKWLSLSAQPKNAQPAANTAAKPAENGDLPF